MKRKFKSKPILETPILYGDDARRFEERMLYNENHPCSREQYNRMWENYLKLKKVFKEARIEN